MQIQMGALAPKLKDQIAKEGYECDKIDFFQAASDSVSSLYIQGFLMRSESDKARDRIVKRLNKALKPIRKA